MPTEVLISLCSCKLKLLCSFRIPMQRNHTNRSWAQSQSQTDGNLLVNRAERGTALSVKQRSLSAHFSSVFVAPHIYISIPGSHDFVHYPLISGDDGVPLQGIYSLGNKRDKVGGLCVWQIGDLQLQSVSGETLLCRLLVYLAHWLIDWWIATFADTLDVL